MVIIHSHVNVYQRVSTRKNELEFKKTSQGYLPIFLFSYPYVFPSNSEANKSMRGLGGLGFLEKMFDYILVGVNTWRETQVQVRWGEVDCITTVSHCNSIIKKTSLKNTFLHYSSNVYVNPWWSFTGVCIYRYTWYHLEDVLTDTSQKKIVGAQPMAHPTAEPVEILITRPPKKIESRNHPRQNPVLVGYLFRCSRGSSPHILFWRTRRGY